MRLVVTFAPGSTPVLYTTGCEDQDVQDVDLLPEGSHSLLGHARTP